MTDWRKTVRSYLALATDILPKLPNNNDSPLTIAVKMLAILDSVDKKIGTTHALSEYFRKLGAKSQRNALFVDLFFSTQFQDSFEVTRLSMGDYMDVVIARDDVLGTLYFVEYHWSSKPEPSDEFWYMPGFDFTAALTRLWAMYDNGIHISMKFVQGRDRPINIYRSIIFTEDPIVGPAIDRLKDLIQRHQRYRSNGFSRTYLFVGKQGSGKSTFATRMSQECGKRTLRINAQGMTLGGASDLSFLMSGLAPDFLILDDIDRVADKSTSIPAMLDALSDLKERHPKVAIILTANGADVFEPAVIRPGRIDRIVKFEDPDAHERRALLTGYILEYKAGCDDLDALVDATEGLTAAYLKEVAIALTSGDTLQEVLETVRTMREYTDKKPEPKKPEEAPKPAAAA